jgi:hypothetical protein
MQAKQIAAGETHFAGPAQRGGGLPFGGMVAGITRFYGESRQEIQATPQGAQGSVLRDQPG